jgi:hypothetical protein
MGFINGSKDGYNKGYKDGLAGNPSNPVSLIEGFKQALRPESYTDTFLSGYHEGWSDGNKKRNNVGT